MSVERIIAAATAICVCAVLAGAATTKPIYQEKNGLVVIQFESAPATDEWVFEKAGPGYSGSGYYTWRGQDSFREPTRGFLTYRIAIRDPGTYHLRLRSLHLHEDTSLENDVWTRMDGGEWKKTFATPNKQWTWMTKHDFGGYRPWASYVLGKGVHVLEFAGRSKNFSIDLIHLYKEGTSWPGDPGLPESKTVVGGNLAPRANAGPEKNVTSPVDHLVLAGSAADIDGDIVGYRWEKISGPSVRWQGENSRELVLTGLQAGEYVLRLRVTDDKGGTGYDETKVMVYPSEKVSLAEQIYALVERQVQFEAEAAPAVGLWKMERDSEGFSGSGYLVWRGNDYFDDPHVGPQLAYRIEVKTPGEYSLRIRNRHDHASGDQENDTWARFDDGPWVKCYSMQKQQWIWNTSFVDFPGFWLLDAGVHTLYLSPRSFGHKLDCIHVFAKGMLKGDVITRHD